jgi:hypothetical protein
VRAWNWRDLRRGCLIGLIAGVGYVLAYQIILFLALDSPYYEALTSLGWLLAVPAPAFLLWYFGRLVQRIDEQKAREQKMQEGQEKQAEQADAGQPPDTEE